MSSVVMSELPDYMSSVVMYELPVFLHAHIMQGVSKKWTVVF